MLARSIAAAWRTAGRDDELIPVTRADADLRDPIAVERLFQEIAPDTVIHTAARVGGIAANIADPAGFLMDNLRLDSNVLSTSVAAGIRRFVYFGSSCMYPKDYRQPLVESDVLAAPLEPTNEGYAISKIAAARYCQYTAEQFGWDYRVIIPSNLYGPGDDFALDRAHLVAATIAKAHEAKSTGATKIDVWGDGLARREFTYVGDLAEWLVSKLDGLSAWPALMNVGKGEDFSILDYYRAALNAVGYEADLVTDPSKPAGMHQKLMDSSVASEFGWSPSTDLTDGVAKTYADYLARLDH
ncbi:NAD-dependent epimerase/dehydratase family protein [Agromyces larvae]|uniref:GDP-L-fucose synthase n=2 Tax=Agromyces larvae TaxID=2929802 RepID=A0ABY4BZ57_9MICO|nr:NAD-dependent epimerase/dehydratase family protein [Agromyces larvae]